MLGNNCVFCENFKITCIFLTFFLYLLQQLSTSRILTTGHSCLNSATHWSLKLSPSRIFASNSRFKNLPKIGHNASFSGCANNIMFLEHRSLCIGDSISSSFRSSNDQILINLSWISRVKRSVLCATKNVYTHHGHFIVLPSNLIGIILTFFKCYLKITQNQYWEHTKFSLALTVDHIFH